MLSFLHEEREGLGNPFPDSQYRPWPAASGNISSQGKDFPVPPSLHEGTVTFYDNVYLGRPMYSPSTGMPFLYQESNYIPIILMASQ